MRAILPLALTLFAALPTLAGAQEQQAKVSVPPPVSTAPSWLVKITPTKASLAKALTLAEMLNSEDLTRRQIARAYTDTMPKQIGQRPEFVEMERLYPGIVAAVIQAERDIVEPGTIASLPAMQKALSVVYADYLTEADLDAVLAFYGSETGGKALTSAAEGSDLSHMINRNLSGQEPHVEVDDFRKTATSAGTKFIGSLTDDDRRKLIAFGFTPAGRKWQAIQPLMFKAAADEANQRNADLGARAADNVVKVMTDFIAKADAQKPTATGN